MSFPADRIHHPDQRIPPIESPTVYREIPPAGSFLEAVVTKALSDPGLGAVEGKIARDEVPAGLPETDGAMSAECGVVDTDPAGDQELLGEPIKVVEAIGRIATAGRGESEDGKAGVSSQTDDALPARDLAVSRDASLPVADTAAEGTSSDEMYELPNVPGDPNAGRLGGEEPDDESDDWERRLDDEIDRREDEELDGQVDAAVGSAERTVVNIYLPGDEPAVGLEPPSVKAAEGTNTEEIDEDEGADEDGEDEPEDEDIVDEKVDSAELEARLERDIDLVTRWQKGDERAVEELIGIYEETFLKSHARRLAMKYAGGGSDYDDILQNGRIKFVQVAKRWDLERSVQLATFVRTTVIREMARTARGQLYPVEVEHKIMDKVAKAAAIDMAHDEARIPRMTDDELAQELGIQVRESGRKAGAMGVDTVRRIAALTYGVRSWEVLEESANAPNTDARIALLHEALDAVGSSLQSQAKNVAIARLFLGSEDTPPMTWPEIAELLTQEGDPADVWSPQRVRGRIRLLSKYIREYMEENR